MKEQATPMLPCRSVFHEGTAEDIAVRYTALWITLIHQMEQEKKILASER